MVDQPENSYALIAGLFMGLMSNVKSREDWPGYYDEFKRLQQQATEIYVRAKEQELKIAGRKRLDQE